MISFDHLFVMDCSTIREVIRSFSAKEYLLRVEAMNTLGNRGKSSLSDTELPAERPETPHLYRSKSFRQVQKFLVTDLEN